MQLNNVLTVILTIFLAGLAFAGSTDYELFEPNSGYGPGIVAESPRIENESWVLGGWMQFENKPIQVQQGIGTLGGLNVNSRTQGRLVATRNIINKIAISVDAPFIIYEDQNIYTQETVGFNDLRLRLRGNFLDTSQISLGVASGVLLPTGNATVLGGTDRRALQPYGLLLAEFSVGQFMGRLNLGYEEKQRTRITKLNATIDDRFLYRVGLGYDIKENLSLILEYDGRIQVSDISAGDSTFSELFLGVWATVSGWAIQPAFALAIDGGFGVPAFRGLVGIKRAVSRAVPAPEKPVEVKPPVPEPPVVKEPEIPCPDGDNNCRLLYWYENKRKK